MEPAAGRTADVACVGETMLLLVPDPPAAPDGAATFRRDIGGAESNVAIHLARTGLRVAWHSALGDDAFGAYVQRRIVDEGVVCTVRRDPHRPTGLYVKELASDGTRVRYYRQGSAASALSVDDLAELWGQAPRLVHTTGITAALSDTCDALVHELLTAQRLGVLRSFDVNYRPALHGAEHAARLRDHARRADIVFCGLDEAHALWGCRSVEEVCTALGGPDVIVVKQGAEGATAVRGDECWFEPAPIVDVVESVGAGDAFAAGFLAALLRGAALPRCLSEAARLAGTVLQVHGDLTPRHQLQASSSAWHG